MGLDQEVDVLGIIARHTVVVIDHSEGQVEFCVVEVECVIDGEEVLLYDFSLERVISLDEDIRADEGVGKQNGEAADGDCCAVVGVDSGFAAHVQFEVVAEHVDFLEAGRQALREVLFLRHYL
jgi:hypothetical protein